MRLLQYNRYKKSMISLTKKISFAYIELQWTGLHRYPPIVSPDVLDYQFHPLVIQLPLRHLISLFQKPDNNTPHNTDRSNKETFIMLTKRLSSVRSTATPASTFPTVKETSMMWGSTPFAAIDLIGSSTWIQQKQRLLSGCRTGKFILRIGVDVFKRWTDMFLQCPQASNMRTAYGVLVRPLMLPVLCIMSRATACDQRRQTLPRHDL